MNFRSTFWFVMFNCAVVIILAVGIVQLAKKATLPDNDLDSIRASGVTKYVLDGKPVNSLVELEYVLDGTPIGKVITVQFTSNRSKDFRTISYYHPIDVVILSVCVCVFLGLGIVVFRMRPDDATARLLYGVLVVFGLLIGTSSGAYYNIPLALTAFMRVVFHSSYTIAPVALLHFVLIFPTNRLSYLTRRIVYGCYTVATLVGVITTFWFLTTVLGYVPNIKQYEFLHQLIRIGFMVYVVASFIALLQSTVHASSTEERKKILWVLFGVIISVVSFVILWILPRLVSGTSLIPEEALPLLFMVAPIMFAIAVVRYRLFDIELIIQRSVVYGLVSGLLLLLYTGIVTFLTSILRITQNELMYVFIPIIIIINVLLFLPATGIIQGFVDRSFFRVRYDFRKAYTSLIGKLQNAITQNEVAEIVCKEVIALMQPELIAFYTISELQQPKLLYNQSKHEIVLTAVPFDSPPYEATYSLLAETGILYGYICIGKKLSGKNYNDEDIDLLVNVSSQCALLLERIILQEQILLEQTQSQRLTELNELKSYFVSGVTHELKTPLTSIKMFAEMLYNHVSTEKATKYLGIIEGESSRLTRLIDNVLNYAKIERGVMEYHKAECFVNKTVNHVIDVMQYQLEMNNCTYFLTLSDSNPVILADTDALTEVLINLLSNSLKYSTNTKHIDIITTQLQHSICIEVRDKGIGIPHEKIDEIFTPFVRLKDEQTARVGGAGLGLALVKHFVDAHNGTITVHSELGKGTSIIITL